MTPAWLERGQALRSAFPWSVRDARSPDATSVGRARPSGAPPWVFRPSDSDIFMGQLFCGTMPIGTLARATGATGPVAGPTPALDPAVDVLVSHRQRFLL